VVENTAFFINVSVAVDGCTSSETLIEGAGRRQRSTRSSLDTLIDSVRSATRATTDAFGIKRD